MFKEYLLRAEKKYCFKIKCKNELTDEVMDVVEKALFKYRPVSIGSPKKGMFQENPMGFMGPKYGETWSVAIELSLPVTPTILETELRIALDYPQYSDDILKVFSPNDLDCSDDETECDEPCDKEDASDVQYGDNYNKGLTSYLSKIEKERAKKTEEPTND